MTRSIECAQGNRDVDSGAHGQGRCGKPRQCLPSNQLRAPNHGHPTDQSPMWGAVPGHDADHQRCCANGPRHFGDLIGQEGQNPLLD